MIWFTIASLTPAALLAAACLWGGAFPALAVLSITVIVFFFDRLVPDPSPDAAETDGLGLSLTLAFVHALLWVLGIWAIGTGNHLDTLDKGLILIGLGLFFGQISNSNAHELIHNSARWPHRIGMAVYCSILFGHHTSAHMKVHHRYAATAQDPNTARLGEGFWRYLIRAWWDGAVAGKRAEDEMRARRTGDMGHHPYLIYALGAGLAVIAAASLAGPGGILALVIISAYAQVQLYLSDYVQHYGLIRSTDASGRVEPIGPQHSWNAPHWYSASMMLNAPRHSDHHMNPARPFPQLDLNRETMPTLPHSLPVMAVLALVPPLWRRIMDRRAARWISAPPPSPAE